VAELSGRGLAPATVQKVYQLLGKVMGAAVDAGMIAQTPCRRVPLPKVEREEMRFLTPAEIARLADAIDQRYRALVLVAAYGGLRIGELAGPRSRPRGPAAWRRPGGRDPDRGAGPGGVRPTQDPGEPPPRRPSPAGGGRARHLATPGGRDELVFTASAGGLLRINGFRARVWRPATRPAGLDGLRIHDLRHTAVALWIAAGASPKEVAARAGHTSVSFTLDRYGHLYPEADEALRFRLDALFVDGRGTGGRVIELPR
jgi:integrase